ncbi:sister chromatid cohesion protein PDS5 homolog [Neltuma alba]|uniref:sister chromatid cohesion protein PDS5 homolog n=1 Tax=Neltuma alba TaxID=207710 RepID=UPI0010A4C12C|nr:sister chromatid cohesion protein PDS5 homolog [Prosopis alba]
MVVESQQLQNSALCQLLRSIRRFRGLRGVKHRRLMDGPRSKIRMKRPVPSAPMASASKELEEQLHEVGSKLLDPPSSANDVLRLLNQLERCLLGVEQSPTKSIQNALSTSLKALIVDKLVRHSNDDVKVSVASCITEIARITAPDCPYDDHQMRVVFQSIVSSFENLNDKSSRLYAKTTSILVTFAQTRLFIVMLDLDCDALILEMFRHFFKAVREHHPENVLSSIEIITTHVIKESEEISLDLLSPILASVKKDIEGVWPNAKIFGEMVLESCAEKLKPYLVPAIPTFGISLDNYSNVLASICEGTSGSLEQNDSRVSNENMVKEEDAKKVNPSQEVTVVDDFKASSSRMIQELRYRNRTCLCNQRASIQISDSDKNPGKLYATCATRRCKYFAWVTPEIAETKIANGERVPEHEMVPLIDRVTKLELENDQLKLRVAHVEEICQRMDNFCSVLRNLSYV